MKGKVFAIHWNALELRERVVRLAAEGWTVVGSEAQNGGAAARAIRASLPDAVVIDLSRSPAHGRETALALRDSAATRAVPVVFVGGDGHGLAKTQAALPDATFVSAEGLPSALDALVGRDG